jgi:N-glycosidase YbiA
MGKRIENPDYTPGFDPDAPAVESAHGGSRIERIRTKRRFMAPETIREFKGEYRFLSNFWACAIGHDGIQYPTVEHAFQAAKTLNFHERWNISRLETPGEAKRAGRKAQIRPDWEQVKVGIMQELVLQKFARHEGLRRRLLDTDDALLLEGNTWGDTFWGVVEGEGHNELGKILMEVRQLLR